MKKAIIITETCTDLRQRGRESLVGVWKSAFLFLLIYSAALFIPAFVIDLIAVGSEKAFNIDNEFVLLAYSPSACLYIYWIEAMCAVVIAGFFLKIARHERVKCTDLLLEKDNFRIKVIGLFFMVWLFTFLWSLLFIVPGIIAGIRYSQVFFIMADDKSKGIMQCIAESKEMMQGNKAKFFIMELSFAGWLILSVLPSAIITAILETYISGIWLSAIFIALCFPVLWVLVYIKSTEANFYIMLKELYTDKTDEILS